MNNDNIIEYCKNCYNIKECSCENPEYVKYAFQVRGHCFGDYWSRMDKYTFEELCEELKVEYIEPTE